MPRSRSVATEPIASTIAASAPNWARFFQSWSAASAGTGVGIGMAGSWSPAAAVMISGRNRASSGEDRPTSRNSPATIGRRSVRHDSRSSLRSRTRPALIRTRSLAVPADQPQEDVLERRPDPLERGQPQAGGDDQRQQPGRGGRLVADRHDEPPVVVAAGDPVHPRHAPAA